MSCNAGTLEVEPDFNAGDVYVANCSVESSITVGDTADCTMTVFNDNDQDAQYTAEVYLDGSYETQVSGIADGGGDDFSTFQISPSEGTYEVEMEVVSASQV